MNIDFTKIVKFFITGGLATLIHYLTMFTLIYFGVSAVASTFIGATTGAIVNYILQYYITFDSNKSHIVTILRYSITVFLGITANTLIFILFYEKLSFATFLAQLLTTVFVTMQNFVLYKFLVFEDKNRL